MFFFLPMWPCCSKRERGSHTVWQQCACLEAGHEVCCVYGQCVSARWSVHREIPLERGVVHAALAQRHLISSIRQKKLKRLNGERLCVTGKVAALYGLGRTMNDRMNVETMNGCWTVAFYAEPLLHSPNLSHCSAQLASQPTGIHVCWPDLCQNNTVKFQVKFSTIVHAP